MEIAILEWFQTIHSGPLDVFMSNITELGHAGIFWIILAVALMCFKRTRLLGISVAFTLIMSLVIGNMVLKPLFHRARPYEATGFTDLLVKKPKDYSFPSGHTYASFGAAWVIWYYYRKPGIAALVLAVIISLSRLYLYVHYPTDVLAGFFIGSFFAFVTVKLIRPRLDAALAKSRFAGWFGELKPSEGDRESAGDK